MTTDQDFPGKVTHFKHFFFFISIAQWSVEEDVTITSKVAKGKGKTRGKNGKPAKWAEEQDNQSTHSFKITIRGNCWCFCIKAGTCIKKRLPRFQHHVRQILDRQRLLCSKSGSQRKSSASTSRFHKGFFFSLPDRVVPFLSSLRLVFSPRTFLRFWFFHEQRFSINKEFPRVNFVKCAMKTKYRNNMKVEPRAVAAKIPPRDSPRSEIMTPSWYLTFYLKIRCSK